MQRWIYDVESDGLLNKLTRLHCLVMIDPDNPDDVRRFRRNEEENTIEEGLRLLEECDVRIGHNIIGFDEKAILKVYPDFSPKGELIDTLIAVRALPINVAQQDSYLVADKKMPGKLLGKHSLDSWGYRVGKHKGDYSKVMREKGLDPWAIWSPEMEDYCQNDVEVNFAVWQVIESFRQPRQVQDEEQDIQSLVTYMEQNGYPFLVAEAEKLAKELQLEFDRLVRAVSVGVKGKFVPHKKHVVGPLWDDPNGINEKKRYARPRREWGEDKSRSWWGEITIPKKSMKSSDPTKRGDRTEGAAYCPAKFKEFTPTSRDQVRELLRDEYAWKPTEWTEKGNPKIDDDVLHDLADNHDVPFARDLADIYMIQKLLGYLANGGEAWIKKYNPETECIHPYTNTGGTVTGRCSHAGPNIGQVPSVITKKIDGEEVVLKGREGRYGYECRSLFYTPELVYGVPWKQVGVDLSGIEFRMLAEETAPFDDGELIEIVTTPGKDIHEFHMGKTGINDRNQMKRVTYALLYGAGDNKLGATASPEAPSSEWRRIGQGIRAQMMEGLPALNEVIDKYHTEAGSGVIRAIDGRDLFCRSPHSALNTRLQSSAAIVAKKWAVIAERDLCENLLHGWEGDFAFLAFVHDELQSGAKEEYAEYVAKTIIAAAAKAGKHYNLRCPIDAASKIGRNWAECH